MPTIPANQLVKQIHNSKKCVLRILNKDQPYEWLFGNSSDERLTQLALSQVQSRDMEYCTISKEYGITCEAEPQEYSELTWLDMSYLDTTETPLYPAS